MRPAHRSIRSIYTLLIGLAIAGLLAACGSSSNDSSSSSAAASQPNKGFSSDQAVAIQGFAYNPADLTVAKGTKVTWTNNDSAAHTATASGTFDTGRLTKGQTGSVTLNTPGTFNYICTIHPSMKGKITVTG